MRKIIFVLFVFITATIVLLPVGFIKDASADGPSIDIHLPLPLPPPPPQIFVRPPEMIIIPGSPVFVAPHPDVDIFFYGDYWWSPRGDHWYRSRDYNGPWREMDRRYIPPPVFAFPRDYRSVYAHEHHIPYGQWKKQWKHGDKMEYKERKEDRWEGRREEKGEKRHGHGHGHGHGDD